MTVTHPPRQRSWQHILLRPSSNRSVMYMLLDPQWLLPALQSFASCHEPLPLTLSFISTSPLGIDGNGNVLFLTLMPSATMLSLHSQLCEALRKEGVENREEYRPGSWVSHCLVAVDVHKNRMIEAFCVLWDLKLPMSRYAMDVRLVEFSLAVCEVFSFLLGSTPDA